jgi:hypothetical protein
VSTAEALLAAVDGADALWLPSGPRDRVLVTPGAAPVVVRGEADPDPAVAATRVVAVDLDGRAPDAALALGRAAVAGLGTTLLRLGAARLARGEADDPERLVPAYASPPRGMPLDEPSKQPDGGVAWSRDPR